MDPALLASWQLVRQDSVNEGWLGTGLKFVTDTNQVIWRKMNTLKYMESHDFDDNQMYNMNQFFIFNLYLDDRGKEKIKKSD